jgi:hypothetical protein
MTDIIIFAGLCFFFGPLVAIAVYAVWFVVGVKVWGI